MTQPHITLISFGYFGKQFLEQLAVPVRTEFGFAVTARESRLDLSEFFDPGRRQYDGNRLLDAVGKINFMGSVKNIGLFSVDLFIPILTYIFGQAELNGHAGIASLYRLHNERYGMAADETLLFERFTKEVIHETGHTFGLIHCNTTDCVMHSSTYVEDIDQKGMSLCPRCREHTGLYRQQK
jgi:archaemetzincin